MLESASCREGMLCAIGHLCCLTVRSSCFQVRPLSTKELIDDDSKPCVTVAPNGNKKQLKIGQDKLFTFDHVFGPEHGQTALYEGCVKGLVDSCLDGYNSCILAYGQTVIISRPSHRKFASETNPRIKHNCNSTRSAEATSVPAFKHNVLYIQIA